MSTVQIVFFLVALGLFQAEEPPRFSTTVSLLEGEWVLDEALSQDPEEVLRNALREGRRPRGRGGPRGGGAGAGRGGFGGRPPASGGQGPGAGQPRGAGLAARAATRLEFRGQDEGLVLHEDGGRTRSRYLVVDGSWQERRGPEGTAIETKTEWVDGKLVIATRVDGRPGDRMEEYEVLPEHDRLVLTVSLKLPRIDDSVTIRRVFDRPVVDENPERE